MGAKRHEDDRELLRRVAGGDEDAFAELFDRHGALCLRRARAVVYDAALAEDAVQEAFVDLWRTADRFDDRRASVTTWLCVLVHRRAVDLTRREARRRAADTVPQTVPSGSYTAEEELLLLLDRRRVREAVDGLSGPERQLIELAYYGGLTQSELADHFGVPLGTIKSRTSAALARLAVAVA